MTEVKIFLTVRERLQVSVEIISALLDSRQGADVYLFDNGSSSELRGLQQQYEVWVQKRDLACLVMNTATALHGVYWSKNYAWAQFLGMVSQLPPEERRYLVMFDNDVQPQMGWLGWSLKLLQSPEAKERNIQAVSPYLDSELPVPTDHDFESGSLKFKMAPRLSQRCIVAAWEAWSVCTPPPWSAKESPEGKLIHDAGEWYGEAWAKAGIGQANFLRPLVVDPDFHVVSVRKALGIGCVAPKKETQLRTRVVGGKAWVPRSVIEEYGAEVIAKVCGTEEIVPLDDTKKEETEAAEEVAG